MTAVLAAVCQQAGLDHRGARLLRFTNNAVFELAEAPVVVRIVASRTLRHRVPKVVEVAEWLRERAVPAVRLWQGVAQPVRVDEDLATLWWRLPDRGRRATPNELARLLLRLHELPPPFPLPRWTPLNDVRRRLDDAEELTPEDRVFLLDRCAELQGRLDELQLGRAERLIHGDAHLGNVIVGDQGPVLCDFDSSCLGPPVADLVPLAVAQRRFGTPAEEYREFCRGYGEDVTRWPGYPVLRDVRELKLTTSVLPSARSNPDVRAELHRRLADLRRGDMYARWAHYR